MGPGDERWPGSTGALTYTGRQDGGPGAAAAAGPDGLRAATLAIPLGRGPGRPGPLAVVSGPRGSGGGPAGNRADGPPDPDSAGRPRLGADPGTVGDAGDAGGPGAGSSPGHAGDARDLPCARDCG